MRGLINRLLKWVCALLERAEVGSLIRSERSRLVDLRKDRACVEGRLRISRDESGYWLQQMRVIDDEIEATQYFLDGMRLRYDALAPIAPTRPVEDL